MNDNKILITNKIVKKQYISSFFYRYLASYLMFVLGFVLLVGVIYLFLSKKVLNNPLSIFFILSWLPYAIIGVIALISSTLEFIRVVSGNFFITTDEIIEQREQTPPIIPGRGHGPGHFLFKNYGFFNLYRAYSSKRAKSISAYRQFEEAYLGDNYYIAVLNKNKRIIAIFNPNDYYYK